MKLKEAYQEMVVAFDKFDAKNERWVPYLYALLGAFFAESGALVVKYHQFPPFELIYCRAILLLFVNTKLLQLTGQSPYCNDKKTFRSLAFRAVFAAEAATLFLSSTRRINLTLATILFQTSPIWSSFIGSLFFAQKFNILTFILTCVAFSGFYFLYHPILVQAGISFSFKDLTVFGSFTAMLGAISVAIGSNINAVLKGKVGKMQLIFYLHIGPLCLSSLLKTSHGYSNLDIFSFRSALTVFLFGFFTYFSDIFTNQALFMRGVNKIMPFTYTQVIFALFFDYFIFHQAISKSQMFAVLLIIVCCFRIAYKK